MGSCTCAIEACDWWEDSYWTFRKEYDRKARKEHECCECKRTIRKGEIYRIFTGKNDDKLDTYKTCADCQSLISAFMCSYIFGEIRRDIAAYISEWKGEVSESCIELLTPAARDWVFEHMEKAWDKQD